MKITVYILETNADNNIVFTDGQHAHLTNCAPDGMFGDVDIAEPVTADLIARLRAYIAGGENMTRFTDLAELSSWVHCSHDDLFADGLTLTLVAEYDE